MRQTKSNHSAVRRPAKKFIAGLLSAAALLAGLEVQADTFYSKGATGDPTLTANWTNTANANPANFTGGDTFIILNGCNFTIPANGTWTVNATTGGTAATVQINASGTLTFLLGSGQQGTLKLGGNLVQTAASATVGIVGSGSTVTGTIEFTSSGTWTGTGDLSNIKANVLVDSGVTLDASSLSSGFKLKASNTIGITVNGVISLGTLQVSGNGNGSASFALGASGTLITARTAGVPSIFTNFMTGKVTLPATANYTFNGVAAQVTGISTTNATMPATVNGLTINNTTGVTLSQATTVTNLTLTAGKVAGNITMGSSAAVSGGSSTAYINGQLTVPFSAPSAASYTFPIGTASAYSPVSIANFTDAGAGSLTATATASQNPNQGTSALDSAKYIARYWTLTNTAGSSFVSPAFDFTGTFVAGDVQGGANTANLDVQCFNAGTWTSPSGYSSTSTTVTGTSFNKFGQFATGEPQVAPNLSSPTKTAVTNVSATIGATLVSPGISPVTEYGVVWSSVNSSPTTADNKVQVGTTPGSYPVTFTTNVTGLSSVTTIYYRGYAITASGTGYSPVDSFVTLTSEPTIQASGVSGYAFQNGNLSFFWVRGNGSKCIVLANTNSAVNANPVDGTTYTASATFGSGTQIGSGNYVAYLGTGTNVTLTGLTSNTITYAAVYELNGSAGSENYLLPPATGSKATIVAPVTTITWTGGQDIFWNNTNNWDAALIPDVGTAVVIPLAPANQPTYSNQMTAASFGTLTSAGTLTINTNGFNCGAVTLNNPAEVGTNTGAKIYIGSNGVMNVSGAVILTSNAWLTVAGGGSLTASGALDLGVPSGATLGSVGVVTNNGGTINVATTGINPGNGSLSSSTATSGNCLFVINGGVNNLGSVDIHRSTSTGSPGIGKDGLAIYNGQVTMSGLNVGGGNGNASCGALVAGGVVTNNGNVFVNQATSTRISRFLQSGGLFVVSGIVYPNPTATTNAVQIYSVTGGTNLVGGCYFGSTNETAGVGINPVPLVYFTNSAAIYVGSQGIASNGVVLLTAAMNDGALFGATADWTGSVPLNLAIGTETFKTADVGGAAHNITYNGVLSGVGGLNVTGGGILTLGAANSYSGSTLISGGTLALGASGSITSAQIMLATGTSFDVSALGGTYSPSASQTISGFGSIAGQVTATTGSIQPGSNVVTGTLTFAGGLAENGGVTNNFVLPGDKIAIGSGTTLSVSGANIVQITGSVSAGSDYTLFDYSGGSFSGSVASFTLVGVSGTLVDDGVGHIKLHATASLRAPTTVVWAGNSVANNWDAAVTTNWLNAGALDDFLTGDTAVFDNQGGINSNVNIAGSVSPGLVVINSSSNYVFKGTGSIIGSGGITVSNGSLTISTTNSYTGPTVLAGGALVISNIANGTVASPIGAASVAAANVVFAGGTLDYSGPTAATDHGITLTNGGGVIDVAGSATLTLNGGIVGNGGLTKVDTGSLTLAAANSYGGNTIVSNGVLTLNDAAAAGSGTINLYGGNLKIGAVKPNNTINVAGNAQVSGGNSGGATGIKNVTGSANLLLAVTTGVFDLTGDMSAYSGTITCSNAGGGGIRLNGSKGSALATWDLGVGTMDLNERAGSTSNNIGALKGGSSTTLSGRGGSSNSGATTYYIGANNLSTEFDGVIQNGNGATGSTPSTGSPTSINKVGSGTLTLNGVSTFTGTAVVNGGAISGTGTISGATTFNAGTVLAPGVGNIGTLSFGGSLTLNANSTNTFAITTAGGSSNSVAVSGALTPNGSVIRVTTGTALGVGVYPLFTYGSVSGSFNATPVFDVAPADTATIVSDGTHIKLQIGTPAPPAISSVDYSTIGSGHITFNATNGTPGASVSILMSTDVSLPLASWSVVATGSFDGSGNLTGLSVPVDNTQAQQFYILSQ
jgi:fibronectin-binding autotransporter adhesin